MNITFQDRVPTYPNRYKVTKTNGTSEFVTLERADEPTVVGTALNANTFNSAFSEIEDKIGSGVGSVARNLLDNSDFRNPVNQRGASSYSTLNAYSIDRWIIGGDVTLTDNGLTGVHTLIQQRLPKGILSLDKAYTLAVYYVGEGLRLATLETADDYYSPYFFTNNPNFDAACFYLSKDAPVAWAALYEGEYTEKTLPEYQPKGYGVELAECRRYYRKFAGFVAAGMCKATNQAWFPLTLDPPMRIVPTVEVIGDCSVVIGDTGYASTLAGSALSTANTLLLAMTPSNKSYTMGAACILDSDIAVSADL